ncbi:MAG: 4Fe-4S dicluster domain-containing protein, partial [Mangrovibacterium sp.]
YSRCVTCMDCIEKCSRDAIQYLPFYKAKSSELKTVTVSPNERNNSRRTFLSMATLLAFSGTLKAQEKIAEGGLAVIEKKKIPNRTTPVTPPGSLSAKNFAEHCTACGLCISTCPNHVLRPSGNLMTLMQPEMSYERGYCRPECTECSEVCPTGAITLITKAEKSAIQIGYAVWMRDNCVVITDDVACGNCARHCPSGAIEMIASDPNDPESQKIPAVNTERCIGCGTCENLCPARPFSAIFVEGIERHRTV